MVRGDPKTAPFVAADLATPEVAVEERSDGTIRLRNCLPLQTPPGSMAEVFRARAGATPDRVFLAERGPDGAWRELTFGEADRRSARVAQGLLDLGLDAGTPIAALSDASIHFGILKLAAFRAGIPIVPVSPAYSLLSATFDKLRHIRDLIAPRLYYGSSYAAYSRAFDLLRGDGSIIVADDAPDAPGQMPFAALEATAPGPAQAAAEGSVGPDTVAKILMTSGSTGMPKGVIVPHRMMCSNGQAVDQCWRFLGTVPPVIVDWLPWSHTFATNFNLNQIIRHGGTMYIDAGRPAPGRMQPTLDNLREIQPTLLYNVPRGFDMLLPELEGDDAFAAHVFERLQVIFYAGAGLPQAVWDRLEALAVMHRGERLPILTSLGSTETGPVATLSYWGSGITGSVGLPVPGTEVKLAPAGSKHEMRVKGPNVTPGYYNDPVATEKAFDEDGFFRLGDAVRFVDPEEPSRGLLFDGRVSENFKLLSGTWVHVGALRLQLLSALGPAIQDAVITGHDREEICLILFPNVDGCRRLVERDAVGGDAAGGGTGGGIEALIADARVRAHVTEALARHNAAQSGSSTRIARAILVAEPPTIDGNEITDKGYINQRAVLERRAEVVARLHADAPGDDILEIAVTAPVRASA